jgi:hypothetical protein
VYLVQVLVREHESGKVGTGEKRELYVELGQHEELGLLQFQLFFIMPAHQFRHGLHFAFPLKFQLSFINSLFLPIRVLQAGVPAIRVSLQIQLSFFEAPPQDKIGASLQFASLRNSSSRCWRLSFSSRKQFQFPPNPTHLHGASVQFPPIRILHHARNTLRVSLQSEFFIMPLATYQQLQNET